MSLQISLDDISQLSDRQCLLQDLEIFLSLYHKKNFAFSLSILKVKQLDLIHDERGLSGIKCIMSTLTNRLHNILNNTAAIYRLNVGQFVIISKPHLSDKQLSPDNIGLVLESLQQPIKFFQDVINIELSLGYIAMSSEISNSSELLRRADIALKLARSTGTTWQPFNNSNNNYHHANDTILFNALKFSLENTELYLAGQPIFDFDTGKVAMVEVLLRWQHAELGSINPLKIVEIAGQNDYLYDLSVYVAKYLINFLIENKERYHDICFAVNFNMPQIINAKLINHLLNLFDHYGIARSRLIFESTETNSSPVPIEEAANHFHWIRQQGVQIAIDDFGSGYSTLDYINNLDVDVIKIDRSLVTDIELNNRKLETLSALLQLCYRLGVVTVIEGIENEQQHKLILACQIPKLLVQGFWYKKPSPLVEHHFCENTHYKDQEPHHFQLASQGN